MTSMKADKKNKLVSKLDIDISSELDELASRIESGDIGYSLRLIERIEKLEKVKSKPTHNIVSYAILPVTAFAEKRQIAICICTCRQLSIRASSIVTFLKSSTS